MKKSALKVLAVVLALSLVLATSISAMAKASVSSTIKYNEDHTAYTVKSDVSGLDSNEMVTYMVTGAADLYNMQASDIDYIDQKVAEGTSAQFKYAAEGDADIFKDTGTKKIYVGAQSLNAPITGTQLVDKEGTSFMVNGVNNGAFEIDPDLSAGDTVAINGPSNVIPYIIGVTIDGKVANFFLDKEVDMIYVEGEITADSVVEFTTSISNIVYGYALADYTKTSFVAGAASAFNDSIVEQNWYPGTFPDDFPTEDLRGTISGGVALNNTTVTGSVNVPVSGKYRVLVEDWRYEEARKDYVTINGVQLTLDTANSIIGHTLDNHSVMCSAGTVELEAGTAYDLAINGTGGWHRFDFAVLVPATDYTSAALDAMEEFNIAVTYNHYTAKAIFEEWFAVKSGVVKVTPTVRIGSVQETVDGKAIRAFARAKGSFDTCGIAMYYDGFGWDEWDAITVNNEGAFCIEVVSEHEGDCGYDKAYAYAKVSVAGGDTETYMSAEKEAEVVEALPDDEVLK